MSIEGVILISFLYLAILFGIAAITERSVGLKNRIQKNPWIYALSLAVYCSAWTYYGSVGRASSGSIDFLTIYLGPTLIAPFFGIVLMKMIRISKTLRLNSLSDFIATRYDKRASLANLVIVFSVLGIVPYVALQIKAVAESASILAGIDTLKTGSLRDPSVYIVPLLGIFAILYATRKIQHQNYNTGLVTVIAFESLIKLLAFITMGLVISFYYFESPMQIFELSEMSLKLNDSESSFDWFLMMMLSMMAFLFLPRQFEMGVVENKDEKQTLKAMWMFPAYLLLINFFVIPIAFAGNIVFEGNGVRSEYYILNLPLYMGNSIFAILTYLGGFSAAVGMIVVSTVGLSRMLSNQLIIPFALWLQNIRNKDSANVGLAVWARRISISLILIMAYTYYLLFSQKYSLVSIGLLSFIAVAQFAPSSLAAMFWKRGNYYGAFSGMMAGFGVWFYTSLIPLFIRSGYLPENWLTGGPLGIELLSPEALFGLQGLSPVTHSFFWSILLNIVTFYFVSVNTTMSIQEINQANIYTDVFSISNKVEASMARKVTANIKDLRALLEKFLGKTQADISLRQYSYRYGQELDNDGMADATLVNYTEKVLNGVIGSSSSKLLINSVVKEEEIPFEEVVKILKESQQLIALNKELKRTSEQLRKATLELQEANKKLKENDELKDEFLYTVTHELRTPLTGILALSEILKDNEDLPQELINEYLRTIIKETERMSRLISQVLDLENFESGKHKLEYSRFFPKDLFEEVQQVMKEMAVKKGITLKFEYPDNLPLISGDFDRLMQVLINLIGNAIKFVPAESGIIVVTAYCYQDSIKVNIADNGPGINPEVKHIIFEKFFQAKNQTQRKPLGSGLGLAISKKIINLHQGNIWVEKSEYGGAKFSFTLPINTTGNDGG